MAYHGRTSVCISDTLFNQGQGKAIRRTEIERRNENVDRVGWFYAVSGSRLELSMLMRLNASSRDPRTSGSGTHSVICPCGFPLKAVLQLFEVCVLYTFTFHGRLLSPRHFGQSRIGRCHILISKVTVGNRR